MNYQQILAISYVFNLMNIFINNPNQHSSNNIVIVKLENTFYLQDSKKNLYLIQENMNNNYNVKALLDTFIIFEEHKINPMNFYLKLRNINTPNTIDYELLKNLQMQYITNKSYFDDYIEKI